MGRPKGPPKTKHISYFDTETVCILEQLVKEGVAPDKSSTIAWALKFSFEARKRKKDIEYCEESISEMRSDIQTILERLSAVESQQKIMVEATTGAASYLASTAAPYKSDEPQKDSNKE